MPLNLQRLERALQMEPFLSHVQGILTEDIAISDDSSDGGEDKLPVPNQSGDGTGEVDQHTKILNGVIDPPDVKEERSRHYNFSKVKKSRKWLKNLLVSDSSESESEDQPISEEEYHSMLRLHKYMRTHQNRFYTDRENMQYQYYSTGLLSNYDKFHEHQRFILGPKKKRKEDKKLKAKMKKLKKLEKMEMKKMKKKSKEPEEEEEGMELADLDEETVQALIQEAAKRRRTLTLKEADARRRKVWLAICKKEINKAQRQRSSAHNNMLSNCRKMAQLCQKEVRKAAMQSQRVCKETPPRARRLTREMLVFWKKYEKVEKEHRKRAEKEAMEQRKLDDELREARRQQRKLNFLITQTELYAHFMAKKLRGEIDSRQEEILSQLEDKVPRRQVQVQGRVMELEVDDYDSELMKATALRNAQEAYDAHQAKKRAFDEEVAASKRSNQEKFDETFSLANPMMAKGDLSQPSFFNGQLKAYQLKGLNWLANLYDQGINGILADEMGLGKTVQSIAFLAHLAEVLPYWGNQHDRKVLRKFWNQKQLQMHTEDAPFHVLITSYQLVVQDVKYFQRIKWQYMVLDEAQAIKSSASVRWKILLGFSCRNRLLLTGTPIQNTMAEVRLLLTGTPIQNTIAEVRLLLTGTPIQNTMAEVRLLLTGIPIQNTMAEVRLLLTGTPIQNTMAEVRLLQGTPIQNTMAEVRLLLTGTPIQNTMAEVRLLTGTPIQNTMAEVRLLLTGTPIQNTMAEVRLLLTGTPIQNTMAEVRLLLTGTPIQNTMAEVRLLLTGTPIQNTMAEVRLLLTGTPIQNTMAEVRLLTGTPIQNTMAEVRLLLTGTPIHNTMAEVRLLLTGTPIQNTMAEVRLLTGTPIQNTMAEVRLLLTGTPIQNTMAELWALLHFIMPTLFDSHEEFNEWFSKDIEGHAENKSSPLDENQLSRLHMILKPFMLRRIKKDVENELSDKIEILVYCCLNLRQTMLYQAVKNKISIEDLLQSSAGSSSQAQSTTSSLMNLVMQFRKVCNHPELFERQEARSPLFIQPDAFILPKLVYRQGYVDSVSYSKNRYIYNMLYAFSEENVHHSLFPPKKGSTKDIHSDSTFSFLRFINTSPAEAHSLMLCGLLVRWLALYLTLKEAYRIHHRREWHGQAGHKSRCLDRMALLLSPSFRLSAPEIASSTILQNLVFTSFTTNFISHMQQTIHFIPETPGHRKRRLSKIRHLSVSHGSKSGLTSPTRAHPNPLSPTRRASHSSQQPAANPARKLSSPTHTPTSPRPRRHPSGSASSGEKTAPHPKSPTRHHLLLPRSAGASGAIPAPAMASPPPRFVPRPSIRRDCVPCAAPAFLTNIIPKVTSPCRLWYSSDRSAGYDILRQQLGGAPSARPTVLYGTPELYHQHRQGGWLFPPPPGGLAAVELAWGWSNIQIPDKEVLVTDSGKLYALDILLTRLKQQGHRVLIYSQMTRMIDILEEFMWHRKHTYMRLDGSSKISDRRDMVEDFQQRSDIFVFLLSTRAGGLGINLTAADTVIFYDSDWNPTVDQQAMDRAHRLGQTKQVTVYRLICKGTIEERILQRAREKSEIQRMVISGGKFSPDTLKPKEVVSLLLDDDELEKKLRQRQEEKRLQEEAIKAKDRKRKREKYAADKRRREAAKKKKEDVVTMETAGELLLPSQENSNLSNPSMDTPEGSLISADDSAVPSPLAPSEMSVGSEATMTGLPQDDSSNDGLLIVDDLPPQQSTLQQQPALQPAVTPPPQVQEAPADKPAAGAKGKGSARGRGRPKSNKNTPAKGGNKAAGRSRKINANSAAAMAGARAGAAAASVAAFQAYGFQFSGGGGTTSGASPGTPPLLRPPVFTPPPSRMASSHNTQPGSSLFSQGVGQGGPFSQTVRNKGPSPSQ
uniref:Chromatin-remodeling ATPase INO80 n=1 Tax=Branchiostoma floridae TaxID=7739 RepID=C3ZMU1_BRAFL|eukprot:XP_002590070.1 hypothetical protein BRAFLDRAFT_123437 [Branchiostoma floridae]